MPEMDQIDVAQQEREVFDWLTARIQMLESGDSSDANKQELALLRILKGMIELRSDASDDASLTDLSIFYWLDDRFKLIQYYKLEI